MRLAIVQPAAAPYRFASFSALAAREDVDLLVAYLSRGSQPYDWRADDREARFPRVVLETAALWGVHPFPIGLRRTLRRFGPDVTIVGGWDEPAYHIVAMGRPRLGRRVVLWVESTAEDRRGRSRVKDAVKRAMLRWADAVLVPGSSARHYCESLGASRRYFVASNAVDNERFLAGARRARHGPAPFRLPRPVFLYVGRLDPEKGVDVLLEAWRRAGARQGSLLLVGTGRMEARLKRQAAGLDRERVRFAGFIPQRDLPASMVWSRGRLRVPLPLGPLGDGDQRGHGLRPSDHCDLRPRCRGGAGS